MQARIEERQKHAGLRIGRLNAIGLAQVAPRARPRQILQGRTSATGAWHDVLEVKGGALQRLVHAAIFAPTTGTELNLAMYLIQPGHCGLRPRR